MYNMDANPQEFKKKVEAESEIKAVVLKIGGEIQRSDGQWNELR